MRYATGLKKSPHKYTGLSMISYVNTKKLIVPTGDFGHYNLVKGPWGMLGNATYGDCAFAGAGHQMMLFNATSGRQIEFTDQGVLSDYASTGFDPATGANDNGTELTQLASYWQNTGLIDSNGVRHKIIGYLAFDPTDPYQLTVATYYFISAGVGINLYTDADDAFDAGKPWTFEANGTDEGLHYAPIMGRKNGNWMHSTWGGMQPSEPNFMIRRADQGFVFLTEEIFVNSKDIDGFGLNELQQDLVALRSDSNG